MGKRKGFTFIEIALFLAVTAALFLGIALGMQNSFFRQRYDDSIQNFFEHMRSIYSKVSNPQSPGKGNSDTAIYGKLMVFGENYDIFGNPIDVLDGRPIYTYDVVGAAAGTQEMGTGNALELLYALNANVVRMIKNPTTDNIKGVELASPEKYEPHWQTDIQNPDGTPFVGSILVVRHPRAGTINTLVLKDTAIQVNEEAKKADDAYRAGGNYPTIYDLLRQYFLDSSSVKFKTEEIDFCISPYGPGESGSTPRQDIRLFKNARNASSVEMIETDGGDNRCI